MSAIATTMTTAQLLTLPQDGMERELIRGELRERKMTRRNRKHAATEACVAYLLGKWLDRSPNVKAAVLSGEAGSVLAENPDSTVGIDVVVFSLEVLHRQTRESKFVVGVPLLAVEILSPSDRQEEIHEKIYEYLRVGVALIWEVDPDFKTVRVFRQNAEPEMFNRTQTLSGNSVLPGFEVAVAELFPDWS